MHIRYDLHISYYTNHMTTIADCKCIQNLIILIPLSYLLTYALRYVFALHVLIRREVSSYVRLCFVALRVIFLEHRLNSAFNTDRRQMQTRSSHANQ